MIPKPIRISKDLWKMKPKMKMLQSANTEVMIPAIELLDPPSKTNKTKVRPVMIPSHPINAVVVCRKRLAQLLRLRKSQIINILRDKIRSVLVRVAKNESSAIKMMLAVTLTKMLINIHTLHRKELEGMDSGPF